LQLDTREEGDTGRDGDGVAKDEQALGFAINEPASTLLPGFAFIDCAEKEVSLLRIY
jgi:hypothetical protein